MVGQYEPQSGTIKIDGTDIVDYTPAELAAIYGVMFQDVAHVAVPIREFVTLSDGAFDRERFCDAIAKAGCKKILDDSVAREETIMGLGLDLEKAREFSGGEWQRLALARLFYADPDVFVMDEPTAALDAKAEYQFFEQLRELGKQHQIIMVSHRLSIARLSTKIIYFSDEGIFVDTYNNLLENVPSYKDLYEMQRSLYFGTEA